MQTVLALLFTKHLSQNTEQEYSIAHSHTYDHFNVELLHRFFFSCSVNMLKFIFQRHHHDRIYSYSMKKKLIVSEECFSCRL